MEYSVFAGFLKGRWCRQVTWSAKELEALVATGSISYFEGLPFLRSRAVLQPERVLDISDSANHVNLKNRKAGKAFRQPALDKSSVRYDMAFCSAPSSMARAQELVNDSSGIKTRAND